MGDLLISGTDAFVAYLSVRSENEYGVKVSARNGSIYLGMCIKTPSRINWIVGYLGIFPTGLKLLRARP